MKKVDFKDGLKGYSGKSSDGLVYYYHPGLKRYLARRIPSMPHQAMNDKYKKISANLKTLKPSAAYRSEMKAYLQLMKAEDETITLISWHNLFVKMMWEMQKKYPKVNLETITREQIESEALPCRNVKTAVEAGLLPKYEGYNKLKAMM